MRHSVLNAEAFTAIFFLFILLLRIQPASRPSLELRVPDRLLYIGVAALTFLAFLPALGMPLLHDSYGHVYSASVESLSAVLRTFTAHPRQGDFFFRPLGYVSFWIDGKWAGFSPFRWHLWSVALHVVNSTLVFALARKLGLAKAAALMAALFFALHGSRPEAVAWVAARFDLLAAFFVLLTLLCVVQYAASGARLWLFPIAVFTTAALLSKESAFCLPLLVPTCLLLRGSKMNRVLAPFALVSLNCAVLFGYRLYLLGGIGGYGAENGSPTILNFSLLRTCNALFFREWALLFFPINWSVPPGLALWLAIAAGVASLITALIAAGRGSRFRLAMALVITVGAALPVQQLLLIGSDLSGVRVLYLPVLGMALFWAIAIQHLPDRHWQTGIAGLMLLFQLGTLEHNLQIWKAVANLSQQSCRFVAGELTRDSSPIAVEDLPATWNGVYFLKNSFPACVLLNSDGALHTLPDIRENSDGAKRIYIWSDSAQRLLPAKSPHP